MRRTLIILAGFAVRFRAPRKSPQRPPSPRHPPVPLTQMFRLGCTPISSSIFTCPRTAKRLSRRSCGLVGFGKPRSTRRISDFSGPRASLSSPWRRARWRMRPRQTKKSRFLTCRAMPSAWCSSCGITPRMESRSETHRGRRRLAGRAARALRRLLARPGERRVERSRRTRVVARDLRGRIPLLSRRSIRCECRSGCPE